MADAPVNRKPTGAAFDLNPRGIDARIAIKATSEDIQATIATNEDTHADS